MGSAISTAQMRSSARTVMTLLTSDDYRVRNTNINSMLKNTLFDLISRDANKRIDLTEARKRLGLQALITAEERGTRKI